MRGDTEITNSEDIIDSRNVIDRISYLEDERAALADEVDNAKQTYEDAIDPTSCLGKEEKKEAKDNWKTAIEKLTEYDESDEGRELKALKALQDDCEGYSDWKHGATLIRDLYFEQHAKELAEDLGDMKDDRWPYTHIDWERAADELKQDYSAVDFDGVEYWIRS